MRGFPSRGFHARCILCLSAGEGYMLWCKDLQGLAAVNDRHVGPKLLAMLATPLVPGLAGYRTILLYKSCA